MLRGSAAEGARRADTGGMPTPVVIDCDPGHDDAIALLLALASPELELLGVTTVAGNQSLEKTSANAIRVLELVDRGDIPVAAGSARPLVRELVVADWVHGESGMDGPALRAPRAATVEAHAVDFLAAVVEASTAPVTLIPTGPLTNVALFLARYPELAARLERIVVMGGAIAEGNVTPAAEFNVWADPEAAARVFASGLDVTMIGLDVTHGALMLPQHAESLRAARGAGAFVAELFDFFHRFHATTYGFPGSPIHDAVAVAHVADPSLVSVAERHVAVECASELCRGRTVVDLWRRTGNPPNVHVGLEIDAERFLALLVERLSSLG
jgi:inosine-uridine nucleoside N-ribohydrolase